MNEQFDTLLCVFFLRLSKLFAISKRKCYMKKPLVMKVCKRRVKAICLVAAFEDILGCICDNNI